MVYLVTGLPAVELQGPDSTENNELFCFDGGIPLFKYVDMQHLLLHMMGCNVSNGHFMSLAVKHLCRICFSLKM